MPRIATALEKIAEALTKKPEPEAPPVESGEPMTKGDILRAFALENGIELVDFKLNKEQ